MTRRIRLRGRAIPFSRLLRRGSVLVLAVFAFAGGADAADAAKRTFKGPHGADEWQRSSMPVRPGQPGKAPFWNGFTKRFIYAPAFDFRPVEGAVNYHYETISFADLSAQRFESATPWAALRPVWTSIPVGDFELKVYGVSAEGHLLGLAGEGRYFRAAPFDGPYHEPVVSYDRSGAVALDRVMAKEYVQYWLAHRKPDPGYQYYRYSAKIFGSLVVGAVAHARLKPAADAERSIAIARIVADYLLGISFAGGTPLEHFPPTYHGERIGKNPKSHAQLDNYMTIVAADSGHAYLDLFDYTRDEKYLEAARKIARTFLKTQLANGTWPLYVSARTGKPTSQYLSIPTAIINYFERLKTDGMDGLAESSRRAFAWIMENPVRSFHWLSHYEDVDSRAYAPYEKMSREQVCDLAIYLFRTRKEQPEFVALAEDLIRFAEDQFLTWEQPEDLVVAPPVHGPGRIIMRPPPAALDIDPGWYGRNWLPPLVHEQYGFWMPSARNTGLMIETYWHAYAVTRREVYLAKAKSIANNFTRVQQLHDGEYPTMFTKFPMNLWINNSIYPAKVMIEFHAKLRGSGSE